MIWKTDWRAADDYAANGTADLDRLLSNYNGLKAMLNSEYGFAIAFDTPVTDGYRTMPFASLLNQIEQALTALEALGKDWPENKTWQPAGVGPIFEDINRWENCGAEIEAALGRMSNTINLGWALGIAHLGLYGGIA